MCPLPRSYRRDVSFPLPPASHARGPVPANCIFRRQLLNPRPCFFSPLRCGYDERPDWALGFTVPAQPKRQSSVITRSAGHPRGVISRPKRALRIFLVFAVFCCLWTLRPGVPAVVLKKIAGPSSGHQPPPTLPGACHHLRQLPLPLWSRGYSITKQPSQPLRLQHQFPHHVFLRPQIVGTVIYLIHNPTLVLNFLILKRN
jgi:hypothetical protein